MTTLNPFQFLLLTVAALLNRQQQHAIDYLKEEIRVLRELLGHKHIRFSAPQRRRLAQKAKVLGRKALWTGYEEAVVRFEGVGELEEGGRLSYGTTRGIALVENHPFSGAPKRTVAPPTLLLHPRKL